MMIEPDSRLWDKSNIVHLALFIMSLEMLPVSRLCDRVRSLKLLLLGMRMDDRLPVRLFPDRCNSSKEGIVHRQRGIPPVIVRLLMYEDEMLGKISFRHDDAQTSPSKASVSSCSFKQMLDGIVPWKQLLTADTDTNLEERNSCSGSSPVN